MLCRRLLQHLTSLTAFGIVPPVIRRPTKTCLIATTSRCGSYWLAEGLYDTSLLGDPQEYFHPGKLSRFWTDLGLPAEATYARYVRAVLAHSASDNGVASAKVHRDQFDSMMRSLRELEGLATLDELTLADRFFPQAYYVHLFRRDTARQAVSYHRAELSGYWYELKEEPNDPVEAIEPDFARVREIEAMLVEWDAAWRTFLASVDRPVLELCYEDIVVDRRAAVLEVLRLVGVDPPAGFDLPESRMLRQSDATTDEWVARYEELRPSLLADTA